MKIRLLFLALLAGGFMNGYTTYGQVEDPLNPYQATRPILIGPVIGFNKSMHGYNMRSLSRSKETTVVPCPVFDGGTQSGFYGGLTYERTLGDFKNSTSSLIFKLVYNTMPAKTQVNGDAYKSSLPIVDDKGNVIGQDIIESQVLHTEEVKYDLVSFEALYKINPIEGMTFGIVAGPTVDYALTMNHTELYELTRPFNARFKVSNDFVNDAEGNAEKYGVLRYSADKRVATINDDKIPGGSAIRFGLKLGAQYEILMGKYVLVPHGFYNLGITNLSSEEDWRVSALQLGIDIRYSLGGE